MIPLTRTAFTYLAFRPSPDRRIVNLLKIPHGITVHELYQNHFDEPDDAKSRAAFEEYVRAQGNASQWSEPLKLVWCDTYQEYVGSKSR